MVTVKQWNLYLLLPWPEYLAGRDLVKVYNSKIKPPISFVSMLINMRYLVEGEFAEVFDSEDEDGLIRSFRKKAGGNRPEKPESLRKKEGQLEGRVLPETS